eukprot:286944-Chlamydomonas_euryale.AAC.10
MQTPRVLAVLRHAVRTCSGRSALHACTGKRGACGKECRGVQQWGCVWRGEGGEGVRKTMWERVCERGCACACTCTCVRVCLVFTCCLAGRLVGSLIGWMVVGRQFDWLVGRLVGSLIGSLVGWKFDRLSDGLAVRLAGWLAGWLEVGYAPLLQLVIEDGRVGAAAWPDAQPAGCIAERHRQRHL